MAKDNADQNVDQSIENRIERYKEWAAGINLQLTDQEIEDRRVELRRQMGVTTTEMESIANAREIESFEEVRDLVERDPTSVLIVEDYQKLDDKGQLINVPFFVNRWWFTDSDEFGREGQFAVMHCIVSRKVLTPAGETHKVVVTDGSTGIMAQLREITKETERTGRLLVRHGLRVSQYTAATDEGPKAAKTYYLT
jgi:hypothetical protein